MSVATSTAIALGVSAASSLAAAKMQSNAAKNAAKTQQAGTDKALGVQQQQNAPYLQMGQQAAARLTSGQAMGKPYTQQFGGPGGSNGYQAFNPQPQGNNPNAWTMPDGTQYANGVPGMQQGVNQGPPQGTLSSLGQGQSPMPPQQGQMPPQAPQQAQGGGMVKLQAPDGSVSQVPEAMAQQFIQRGARRVG